MLKVQLEGFSAEATYTWGYEVTLSEGLRFNLRWSNKEAFSFVASIRGAAAAAGNRTLDLQKRATLYLHKNWYFFHVINWTNESGQN